MSRGSFCEEVTFEVRLEDEKEPAKQRSGGNLPGRRYRNIRARQESLWYSKKQNKAGVTGEKEENLERQAGVRSSRSEGSLDSVLITKVNRWRILIKEVL